MKLKKKTNKKWLENDSSEPELTLQTYDQGSWDGYNLIKSKLKQITKLNFQSTQCWRMKLRGKKSIIKRRKKTRVNPSNPRTKSWD